MQQPCRGDGEPENHGWEVRGSDGKTPGILGRWE